MNAVSFGRVPEARLYEAVRLEALLPDETLVLAPRRKLFARGGKKIGRSYWYPAVAK